MVQKMLGYCFECGDYVAEGDVCHCHAMSVLSKCIIKLFSFDTFVIITTQPSRRKFLCPSAVSDFLVVLAHVEM